MFNTAELIHGRFNRSKLIRSKYGTRETTRVIRLGFNHHNDCLAQNVQILSKSCNDPEILNSRTRSCKIESGFISKLSPPPHLHLCAAIDRANSKEFYNVPDL